MILSYIFSFNNLLYRISLLIILIKKYFKLNHEKL